MAESDDESPPSPSIGASPATAQPTPSLRGKPLDPGTPLMSCRANVPYPGALQLRYQVPATGCWYLANASADWCVLPGVMPGSGADGVVVAVGFPQNVMGNGDVVVPVPAHRGRPLITKVVLDHADTCLSFARGGTATVHVDGSGAGLVAVDPACIG